MITAPGQHWFNILAGFFAAALAILLLLSPALLQQKVPLESIKKLQTAVSLRNLQPPPPKEEEELHQEKEEPKPEPLKPIPLTMQQPAPPTPRPMLNEPLALELSSSLAQGVSVALPQAAGPLSLSAVDEPPVPMYTPSPTYPRKAKRQRLEAKLTIKMVVTAEGTVQQASIIAGEHLDIFSKPALASVAKWRFSPAKLKGKAVPVLVTLPMEFRWAN